MRHSTKTILIEEDLKPLILNIVGENSNLTQSGKLIYPKEITVTSHWQKSLITTLLQDLNMNPIFPGVALLETLNF